MRWFEEPVSSDNIAGLREVRARAPIGMDIAAGEYGYTAWYFERMLQANAVTVLQADATRCGGISGFFECRFLVLGRECSAFLALRAQYAPPCLLRCSAGNSYGVFSRSRPHRADVL